MSASAHHSEAQARFRSGDLVGARSCFETALAKDPGHWASHHDLGFLLRQLGDRIGATLHVRASLAIAPDLAAGWTTVGLLAGDTGAFGHARRAVDRARLITPDEPTSLIARAELATDGECAAFADRLTEALRRRDLTDRLRARLLHALGRTLDRVGDPAAFDAVSAAHALRQRERPYAPAEDTAFFASIVEVCSQSWWRQPAAPPDSGTRPIFIVGMPRSGTTLLEQMLSRHPDVTAGGESLALQTVLFAELPVRIGRDFPECLAAAGPADWAWVAERYLDLTAERRCGASVFTDKLPANFLLVAPILKAFPNARILHMTRDPLDTCVSCYLTDFAHGHNFAGDLGHLGHHFRLYQSLMAHWRDLSSPRLMDVSYETLVADPKAGLRDVLAHCGLRWDPSCLAFDRSPHAANTAAWQRVRSPLDRRRVGHWRRYEKRLGRLVAALTCDGAAPLDLARRSLVWQPDGTAEILVAAEAAYAHDNRAQGCQWLERVRLLAPDHPRVLARAAVTAERAGDTGPALALWVAASRAAPSHAAIHTNLAVAHGKAGDVRAAIRSLHRSLALTPDVATAWSNLGNFLMSRDLAASLRAHVRATRIDPADPGLYGNQGLALLHTAQGAPAAERALQRALALDPADRAHGVSLYHLVAAMGRDADALVILDRLRRCHPLDPGIHFERGCALRDAGRDFEAVEALRRATLLAPEVTGWRHVLDSLVGRPSRAAPVEYVRELFDQYADLFDRHLTERLRYRTPTALADAIARACPELRAFGRVLDLGCGTGLMGAALRERFTVGHLTGVDISRAMLAKLREKGGYEATAESDIDTFLERTGERYDLIAAADVLVYFGALERVFARARQTLAPSGIVAVSVERSEASSFELKRHGRYAHSPAYVEVAAAAAGLRPLLCEPAELRDEGRKPVIGLLVILAAE